jgi:electron transfer flavoprotein-quinone oxidoreductase
LYDVIVIGAGPAGSEAAFRLAKRGHKVLIVEKEAATREKACAGGVGRIEPDEFGQPPNNIIEREITQLLFVSRGLYRANFSIDHSLITVMRSKYDSWLQRRAIEQGAKIIEKTRVKKVMLKGNPKIIVNSGTILKTRLLVDASGAQSVIRRSLGLGWSREDIAIAVQYHIKLSSQEIDEKIGNCCELYYDSTSAPEGYYWIFPKRDIVAVGIGASASRLQSYRINLKEKLDFFINKHPLVSPKLHNGKIKLRQSAILPFGICKKIVYPNAVIVGDAGGFVNPIFKDGIYSARKSAEIASKYGNAFLETGQQEQLSGYELKIKARFHNQRESNRLIGNILNDDEIIDKLIQKATQTKINSFSTFITTLKILSALNNEI